MIAEYPRADAGVVLFACRLPSYHASEKPPSCVYLHDLGCQRRNLVWVEVAMVDENHRRGLIGSVLSTTAFCCSLCDEWKF